MTTKIVRSVTVTKGTDRLIQSWATVQGRSISAIYDEAIANWVVAAQQKAQQQAKVSA